MKKTRKDYEYLETSPELEARGLRRISRPKFLDQLTKGSKSRITIYLDAGIVEHFKEIALREGVGYQTLINEALLQVVIGDKQEIEKEGLKEELLTDKKFLNRLKTALRP